MSRSYHLFGVDLQTPLDLPAPPARGAVPLWTAEIAEAPAPLQGTTWALGDDAPEAPFDQGQRDGTRFLAFAGLAVIGVDAQARRIRVWPSTDLPPTTLAHLIVDQALPRALTLTGAVLLHASGVVIEGRGVLFAGPSGAGKSTLVTALTQAGHALLSDDGVLLRVEEDVVWGWGSYPGVRLWPDSADRLLDPDTKRSEVAHYAPKVRAHPAAKSGFEPGRVAVARLHVLETAQAGSPIDVVPVGPSAAFQRLAPWLLRLDFRTPALVRAEFLTLSTLCRLLPMRRLIRPLAYEALADVVAAVVTDLARGP